MNEISENEILFMWHERGYRTGKSKMFWNEEQGAKFRSALGESAGHEGLNSFWNRARDVKARSVLEQSA